jgi:hypothetical protein
VTPETSDDALLDMESTDFRAAAHAVVDLMADYLEMLSSASAPAPEPVGRP